MTRNIHTIDLTGQSVGRAATAVALLLRGKNKATFNPACDEGDIVIIKNVQALKFTGRKMEQKVYYKHTGYIGHLRTTSMKDMWQKSPTKVFSRAVYHMLPKNKLRTAMIKRLKFV